jgi:hypothetical protein
VNATFPKVVFLILLGFLISAWRNISFAQCPTSYVEDMLSELCVLDSFGKT